VGRERQQAHVVGSVPFVRIDETLGRQLDVMLECGRERCEAFRVGAGRQTGGEQFGIQAVRGSPNAAGGRSRQRGRSAISDAGRRGRDRDSPPCLRWR
jgi:hypothetical protein